MTERNKIVAKPSLLQIGFSTSGILFFFSITFYLYNSEWIINENSDEILIWILFSLFSFFSICCLYWLLNSKKVILTNESLTIAYPLLFRKKIIDFNDVKKVTEDNYIMKSSHDFSTIEVYNGNKTIVELFDSKRIVITSFEVTNYKNLSKNLRHITKSYYKINIENDKTNSTQGYGWLVLILILTFGLIAAILQNRK